MQNKKFPNSFFFFQFKNFNKLLCEILKRDFGDYFPELLDAAHVILLEASDKTTMPSASQSVSQSASKSVSQVSTSVNSHFILYL